MSLKSSLSSTRSTSAFIKVFLATLATCSTTAFADDQFQTLKWLPWFEFSGYHGNVRTRGEGALWAPLWQSEDALVFTDLRGKFFEEGDAREGNFALGYRQMFAGYNVGVWAGFDARRSELGNRFNQISSGFELLSRDFDFRSNIYIPLNRSELVSDDTSTTTTQTTQSDVQFDNGSLSIFNTVTTSTQSTRTIVEEHAMFGIDGEVGFRLPIEELSSQFGNKIDLRLYAGGYYFDSKDVPEAILGPRVRLELRIDDILPWVPNSRLTTEVEYQYDDVRDHQYEVGLRLRIPFGSNTSLDPSAPVRTALNAQEIRMSDGLERDTDIVHKANSHTDSSSSTSVKTNRENLLDSQTGARLDRLRFADARSDLGSVIERAGSNSLIVASGRAGAFHNTNVQLKSEQTLVGTGSSIIITGSRSGRKLRFHVPGQRPEIIQDTNDAVIVVNDQTHVVGVDVTGGGAGAGTGNIGIRTAGKHVSRFSIEDVSINNTDGHGIRTHSYVTDYTLDNIRISNVSTGNGLDIENDNTNFAISNVSYSNITRIGSDAIHASRRNDGVISNSYFGENIGGHLLRLRDNNILRGTGNINESGSPLCQDFGGSNLIEMTFNDTPGCG